MAERSGRPRWMRDAGRGLLLLVTAVSLYLLLPSLISVFSSWRSLEHLNWYWAGPALLAEIASFASLWRLDRIALRTTYRRRDGEAWRTSW